MQLRPAVALFAIVTALAGTASAAGADTESIVIGERHVLHSEIMGEDRTVLVSRPPGTDPEAPLPVLYLTDAETQFEHTVATTRFLARNGLIPPLLVVGVTNTDRTRDLTPTRATLPGPDGQPRDFPTAGGADRFLDFFQRELVPWVERRYPTASYRLFAGHSFGGLFAVHAFLTRPDLFQAVIAVSPSLSWDERLELRTARQALAAEPARPRALFLTLGGEGQRITAAFEEFTGFLSTLRLANLRWGSRMFPDEDHGSVVLRSHERGLRFIFDGWRPPADPATGWPAGTVADLEGHFDRLSQRLGITVRVPENALNLLGYRLLGEERHDDALAAFRRATELYPGSANVWDSLGEALLAAGRAAEARDSFARALDLSEGRDDPNRGFYREHLAAAEAAVGD